MRTFHSSGNLFASITLLPLLVSFTLLNAAPTFGQTAANVDVERVVPTEPAESREMDWLPDSISLRGMRMDLADRSESGNLFLAEYVAKNETLDKWTVLFAVRFAKGDQYDPVLSVAKTAENIKSLKKRGDQIANFGVIEDIADGSWIIDFVMTDIETEAFEHSIFRYFKVEGGLISYQYARRAFLGEDAKRLHLWRDDPQAIGTQEEVADEFLESISKVRFEILAALTELDLGVKRIPRAYPADKSFVPTPQMALQWNPQSDPREWQIESMDANRNQFEFQLVLKGKSAVNSGEKVIQQIVFTKGSLREYVDAWKSQLESTDAAIKTSEKKNAEGSLTVTIRLPKTQEVSIRRFLKANDGIYMFAYTRPETRDDEYHEIWSTIIDEASLRANPQRWKWQDSS